MIGALKGVSQVGRYVLTRKQQEREAKNRFMLENLKNAMWNRRLQEESNRAKMIQDRLIQSHLVTQQEQTKRAQIKADYDAEQERLKREAEKDTNSLDYKIKEARYNKLKKEIENIGKGKGPKTEDEQERLLDEIETFHDLYSTARGKLGGYETETYDESGLPITTKGQKYYGGDPELQKYYLNLINERLFKLTGKQYVPPPSPTGAQAWQKRSPGLGRGLAKAYKQMKSKVEKPLEEMSNEELFKELTR